MTGDLRSLFISATGATTGVAAAVVAAVHGAATIVLLIWLAVPLVAGHGLLTGIRRAVRHRRVEQMGAQAARDLAKLSTRQPR